MRRVNSLEKTLMLGGIGGRRRRGWQRKRWLNGITDSMGMSLGKLQEFVVDREAWRTAMHGVAENRIQLSNWAEITEAHLHKMLCFTCMLVYFQVDASLKIRLNLWLYMWAYRSMCTIAQPCKYMYAHTHSSHTHKFKVTRNISYESIFLEKFL